MKAYKVVISSAVLGLALVSCGGNKPKSAVVAAVPVAELPSVKVETARVEKVEVDQKYSVTLQAFAVNNIAPQTSNRIISIKAEVGDFVKKGQVLAEMDKAQLEQAELQLSNLKSEYERAKALRDKGGVSQSDFESIELQYRVAQTSLNNLRINTVLESPLDGVVSARNYDQGDMYSMSSPLFVVQQINPMKALVAVSEKDYTYLKKGVKVEFIPEAFGGKVFTGKVARVYPTIDPATHTVTAEVEIENSSYELRPGMYSAARVIFGVEDALVISDSAIVKQQGSGVKTVFVLKSDNTVELRVVELGRHAGSDYVVKSGINPGETVVISGQSILRSGSKVQVIK